jgi:DNA helicase-2/ATP-dependent DNA helicase PcrA
MFVKALRDAGMTPGDFLNNPESSYLKDFYASYRDKEFVIFDTETTGLNVFEDDIIQIAAIKVRNGMKVPGSEFDIILKTEREIPKMLGKKVNPMVEVYNSSEKIGRREGLELFLNYVGNAEVLGHNVSYDINILRNNVLRYCGGRMLPSRILKGWDSLKIIRLIQPYLRVYKLESLLDVLGLEGINSHKADDDILATKSLVDYCYANIPQKIAEQNALMSVVQNRSTAEVFLVNYKRYYLHTIERLNEKLISSSSSVLVNEMEWIYHKNQAPYWLSDDIYQLYLNKKD